MEQECCVVRQEEEFVVVGIGGNRLEIQCYEEGRELGATGMGRNGAGIWCYEEGR